MAVASGEVLTIEGEARDSNITARPTAYEAAEGAATKTIEKQKMHGKQIGRGHHEFRFPNIPFTVCDVMVNSAFLNF